MKGMTIALAVLLLMLGAGTARAASGADAGDRVPAAVVQAAPESDADADSASLYLETTPDFRFAGDTALSDERTLSVWGYEFSPQMSVDLGFRPPVMEATDFGLERDSLAFKQLAKNLMVGFRYNF